MFKARSHGIVEQAVTRNTTKQSGWFQVRMGEGFSFWFTMTATGAPSVSLYVDYSPFELNGGANDPRSTTKTNYVTATLATAVTTKDTLIQYAAPTATKAPFVSVNLRAVEGDVAAVSSLTFVACRNTVG